MTIFKRFIAMVGAIVFMFMMSTPDVGASDLGYKVPMLLSIPGGQASFNTVASWPDGYVQDKDTILIAKAGFEESDTLAVNTLADNIRARFPNVKIGVRTFGQKHMRNLKNAPLSSNITILSYVYEPRWAFGDEPEFSIDFTKTIANYEKLQREMRAWTNQGKEIWTEPTGRGLPHRDFVGWNYAEIGQYVNVVAVQAQHNAQEEWDGSDPNSYRDALAQVASDMAAANIDMYYMQISVGAEVNGVPGQDAYDDIFDALQVPSTTPGLHLWINPKSFLTDGRTFMDNWAPLR